MRYIYISEEYYGSEGVLVFAYTTHGNITANNDIWITIENMHTYIVLT
jgi:hypothetical protein